MCMRLSIILLSKLCNFFVGNCSYINARPSCKQGLALKDRVIIGVLQIIGLCFANDQSFAPFMASEQLFSSRDHATMWVLQINKTVSNQHACQHWLGFTRQTALGMNVGTSSSMLNAKSHMA